MVNFMTTEQDILVPADEKTLMSVFDLPMLEARFLHAMLNRTWVGKDELPAIKYSIRQIAYKLRLRLEARDRRIWIINDGSGRYGVTPTGKLAIKGLIERATQLTE
jgi:hypothetical protein